MSSPTNVIMGSPPNYVMSDPPSDDCLRCNQLVEENNRLRTQNEELNNLLQEKTAQFSELVIEKDRWVNRAYAYLEEAKRLGSSLLPPGIF